MLRRSMRRNSQPTQPYSSQTRKHKSSTLLVALLFGSCAGPALTHGQSLSPVEQQALARHYGFSPVEIFKLDFGISKLLSADVNNDGLNDLIVANNSKSTLEVLLQRRERPSKSAERTDDVNDLVNDWRFERKRVSVVWRVDNLRAAELTGDQYIDLVMFGEPKELVVLPGRGDGTFGDAITRRVRDGIAMPDAMVVADFNADGKADVALLADDDVLIFHQDAQGGLGNPTRSAHALEDVAGIDAADVNGDGLSDLVLYVQDPQYPVSIRLQDTMGHLGPLQRVRVPAIRSLYFDRFLNRRQDDMIGVERVSGRLKRWALETSDTEGAGREPAVLYYPVSGKGGDRLPMVVADVDGDGRADVVSADVDAAQLVLMLQKGSAGLQPPQRFGGQIKMRSLCAVDADGDGRHELIVVSPEEESLARSQFDGKRLSFPKALPTRGKPYVVDAGRIVPGGPQVVAYVSRDKDSNYELVVQRLDAGVADKQAVTVTIEGMDEPPTALRLFDVNRDGREDVLIYVPYGPLVALLQSETGAFVQIGQEEGAQQGLVKGATPAGTAFADMDGDGRRELLVAQSSFVRSVFVNERGMWETLDQFNAPSGNAVITGVTTLNTSGAKRQRVLAMYDRVGQEVHLYVPKGDGTYTLDRSISVGTLALTDMMQAPLGLAGGAAIMLVAANRIALIDPARSALRAHERGVYETSIKDGHLTTIAVGDLNHDDRTDVVVLEVNEHYLELLTFGPDEALVRATKFRVFAKKQYFGGSRGVFEPREVYIDDVTGDGRNDLILIAHDRILLYPGE